jgi:hypothetical protein
MIRRLLLALLLFPSLGWAVCAVDSARRDFAQDEPGMDQELADYLTARAPLLQNTMLYGAGIDCRATFTGGVLTGAGAIQYIDGPNGLLVPRMSGSPAFTPNGYLAEGAIANTLVYSNDLTRAAGWTANNMNRAFTSTGPNGVANDATRLTATTNNGYIVDAAPVVGTGKITSVWIKRITGTGAVYLANGGGSTWEAVTVTTSWTRVSSKIDGGADTGQGIKLATSGDAVDVWGFTQWTATFAYPSTLVTQAVAASVSADVGPTYAVADNLPTGGFATVGISAQEMGAGTAGGNVLNLENASGTRTGGEFTFSGANPAARTMTFYALVGGSVVATINALAAVGVGTGMNRWDGIFATDAFAFYRNGALQGTDTSGASPTTWTDFRVGSNFSGSQPIYGNVSGLHILGVAVSAADVARLR